MAQTVADRLFCDSVIFMMSQRLMEEKGRRTWIERYISNQGRTFCLHHFAFIVCPAWQSRQIKPEAV